MNRERALELADFHLGPGKYNPGNAIAFAQACEREGMAIAARLARAMETRTVDTSPADTREDGC